MKETHGNSLIQISSISLISILLIIRRDGYFPFSKDTNDLLMIIISSIQIFTIFILICIFFRPEFITSRLQKLPKLKYIKPKFILAIIYTTLLATTFLIFYKDYRTFPEIYLFNIPIVLTIFISALFVIFLLLKEKPKALLVSLFLVSTIISFIPIAYFPITAKIGDLMPIVEKQTESLITGENIYQYYLLDNGVLTQAVRQPGTALAYLPGTLLGIDLRIMSVLYTLGSCFILIKFAYKKFSEIKFDKKFLLLFSGLLIFLLSPYRLSRLDLYEPPFWFLLTLGLYLLNKRKLLAFSIVWGLGILTQVWFWLFTPFVILYLFKNLKLKKTTIYSSIIGILGIGSLALFILRDTNAYVENVFGFYKVVIEQNHYNNFTFYLTPWFIKLGFKSLLEIFQFSSIGLIGLIALKYLKTFKTLLIFLAFSFFTFIQFNSLSWNYMYLNLILIMLIYLFSQLDDRRFKD